MDIGGTNLSNVQYGITHYTLDWPKGGGTTIFGEYSLSGVFVHVDYEPGTQNVSDQGSSGGDYNGSIDEYYATEFTVGKYSQYCGAIGIAGTMHVLSYIHGTKV